MEQCISRYPDAMLSFGEREDEHAGEQFYNYVVRDFIYGWMRDGAAAPVEELFWCTGESAFDKQMDWFESKCNATCDKIEQLHHDCAVVKGSELWKDSVLLQTEIHKYCLKGSI